MTVHGALHLDATCCEFGVSAKQVRSAIDQLRRMGHDVRSHGRGTGAWTLVK